MTPATSDAPIVVLDSSVGVKWIKHEAGRDQALALLKSHRDGTARIVVAAQFTHELVAVAVRRGGSALGRRTWDALSAARLTTIGLDDRLASRALEQCERLGCSFYDALAPALARDLAATLYSADARAHSQFEGVRLV